MNLTYVNFWEYLRWITITDLILKSHRLPKRQPLVELAMMDEQNFFVVNNKNRNGEINFFVDVGHGGMANLKANFDGNFNQIQTVGFRILAH